MPVRIVLYAEDIAVGSEIVNHALKLGGALSVYEPDVKPPIKPPKAHNAKKPTEKSKPKKKARMKASTLLSLDYSVEVAVTEGSVRARVWSVIEDLPLPLTRQEIAKQVANADRTLDAAQAMTAVKWLLNEGVLRPTP